MKGINNLRTIYAKYGMTKEGYDSVHFWLRDHYGRALKCESNLCLGDLEDFQWALIRGKKYEKNRKSFWQLCRRCHRFYDLTIKAVKIGERRFKDIIRCNFGHKFTKKNTMYIGGVKHVRNQKCRICYNKQSIDSYHRRRKAKLALSELNEK